MKIIFMAFALALTLASCAGNRTAPQQAGPVETSDGSHRFMGNYLDSKLPRAVIYKTDGNYDDLVPVTMDAARTVILSYPAPTDIYDGTAYRKPTKLIDGYLLDNRGITRNTVFLDYTYEEYAKLDPYPTAESLSGHIKVKYPLVEMYLVERTAQPDKVAYYNSVIKSGFPNCEKIELK